MKKILKGTFALLLLITVSVSTQAQDSLKFLSTTYGAACYQVAYQNDYLYTGSGATLQIYDVGPGESIPYDLVWEYKFRSLIVELVIKDDFLYVAANHDGISKWDLSDPANPQMLYDFIPPNIDDAAYDIAFYGDSLYVGYDTEVGIFYDNGSSFTKTGSLAEITNFGTIRGIDIKDDMLAVTKSLSFTQDGVYLYDIPTGNQIAYHQQNYGDPEDVVFGETTDMLHVLGGTQNSNNVFDIKGYFYTLDLTIPTSPQVVYEDTLDGIIGFTIVSPMNAEIRNDTLYVATQSALKHDFGAGDTISGYVYAYDCTQQNNVQFINSLPGGLWHFDVALQNNLMHVASEWYGIQTVDISDLFNPVVEGRTLTGGWNIDSDTYGNFMVVGNEGYGFKRYDISNPENPVLLNINEDKGFCMKIKYSQNADYIYGLYLTGDRLRVFDATTLAEVGTIQGNYGIDRMEVYGNRVFSQGPNSNTIIVMDVSNPAAPTYETTIGGGCNDLQIDPDGNLFVSNNDSLIVYDVSGGTIQMLTGVQASSGPENFKSMGVYDDTIFVYVDTKGLVRYSYDDSGTPTLTENSFVVPPYTDPEFIAVDEFGCYLGYRSEGLYAFNKNNLNQTSYFRTSLNFVFDGIWGIHNLYCKNGLIFLVEYFAQTTILTNDNGFLTGIEDEPISVQQDILPYPNPVSQGNWIYFDVTNIPITQKPILEVFDLSGKSVSVKTITTRDKVWANTNSLDAGNYLYRMSVNGASVANGMFVVN